MAWDGGPAALIAKSLVAAIISVQHTLTTKKCCVDRHTTAETVSPLRAVQKDLVT